MTDNTKQNLHSYGFFTTILLFMFLILFLVVFFTRNSGTKSIKSMLEEKIDIEFNNEFNIGEAKNLNLPINMSSYAFDVVNSEGDTEVFGSIITLRLTSVYGPVVGVFFQKPNTSNFEYLGSLMDFTDDEDFSWNKISNSQINYWRDNMQKYLILDYAQDEGEE